MNKLNVFIKDTFLKILKSVSFLVMLLSPIVLIGIISAIAYFASEFESGMEDITLAVLTDDPSIVAMLEEGEVPLNIDKEIQTEEEAREQLIAEELDGYLEVSWEGNNLNADLTYTGRMETHILIIEQILTSMQSFFRASELNLSPQEVQSLQEPVVLDSQIVSVANDEIVEEDGKEREIQLGSAYFINIVILMFITFYATTIIEEIAGEKGTRMMEVILSSTTATTHFFGKLIGVFLVMIIHIIAYIIIGIGAYQYFKDFEFVRSYIGDMDVAAIIVDFLEFSSIFLVIGVIMFMFIAAFFGSLITKTEDINRAATPLSLITVLGFYIGLFAIVQPESPIVVIASFVPLLTPFVMPFRVATDTVSNLHVWLSIGGATLFTVALAWVSLLFYRANVLIYSDTNFINTIKQSWTLVRSENR